MLSQLLLFPRSYIPITLLTADPEKAKRDLQRVMREQRRVRRAHATAMRRSQMLLDSLHGPLGRHIKRLKKQKQEQKLKVEDRTSVEEVLAPVLPEPEVAAPQAIGMGPEIDDEPIEWTNPEIIKLHSVLLEESLKTLGAKGNPSEKLDVLKWVFEIDYVETLERETSAGPCRQIILNTDVPFSFAFCCKLEGMDPANIRQTLRRLMPEAVNRFLVS